MGSSLSLRLALGASGVLATTALAPFLCIYCSAWAVRALQIVFVSTLVTFAIALPVCYGYAQWRRPTEQEQQQMLLQV